MAERDYQRLTRSRTRRTGMLAAFATRSSLWLGKDHLLCADSTGYSETYRRFYFRDIQVITLVATKRRAFWNWTFGALTVLILGSLVFYLLAATMPGATIQTGVVLLGVGGGSFYALALLVNNLLGPACKSFIRTAVQVEELPSLCRVRRTRKVLARLRPLIVAAQGQLTPEEIERKLTEKLAEPPVIARNAASVSAKPPQPYQGPFHQALCWLLIADLPLTALALAMQPGAMDTVSMSQFVLTVVFALVCLAKQHDTDLSPDLTRLPWLVLGVSGVFLFVGMIYAGIYYAMHAGAGREDLAPQNNPTMLVMAAASTGVSLVLGVMGVFGLRRFRLARGGFAAPPPELPTAG